MNLRSGTAFGVLVFSRHHRRSPLVAATSPESFRGSGYCLSTLRVEPSARIEDQDENEDEEDSTKASTKDLAVGQATKVQARWSFAT